jgi:Xaa-Pro aminopeptidase
MITQPEFASRRQQLLDSMLPNSVCVIPAAGLVTRSRDTEYPFRQDSDFWYLCGFPEPEACLLLSNSPSHQSAETVLFCLEKDPLAEIWHGRRKGPEKAIEEFGFSQAFTLEHLDEFLLEYTNGHQHIYFAQGQDAATDELVFDVLKELRAAPKQSMQAPSSIIDVRPLIHQMRLVKSAAELELMQQAANISCEAHKRAMCFAQPGTYEYQLEAEIHHAFAMAGAKYPAYGTIVGSGENACILHYTENSAQLLAGDLVLIDAGCELQGYAADITRTFPVSGTFSQPQKQLYQLVLDAQQAAFSLLKPGNTLKQATDEAIKVITQGLIELGILQGSLKDNIKQQTYRQYFMHGLSHWLGLDVHDVGDYKIDGVERPLQAGMVLTVEPGIYISPDAEVEHVWRGIGIRIEDNLVITDSGHHNLTQAAPKTIADIEALMAAAVNAPKGV